MFRHTLPAVLLLLSLFSLAGCGSSSSEVTEQIATARLGDGTVAVVSDVPSDVGVISDEDFDLALEITAAGEGMEPPPSPGSPKYEEFRDAAMQELLQAAWLEGEGEEMGIDVTQREINTELERIKRESFKTEVAYRRFLRETHMSEETVEDRVRLQLLSSRIQEEVGGGEDEFADFVSRYEKKWRARTLCAPDYQIERCSNGPTP
jgi:hypothetical protein